MPYNYSDFCSRKDTIHICVFCILTVIGVVASAYALLGPYLVGG